MGLCNLPHDTVRRLPGGGACRVPAPLACLLSPKKGTLDTTRPGPGQPLTRGSWRAPDSCRAGSRSGRQKRRASSCGRGGPGSPSSPSNRTWGEGRGQQRGLRLSSSSKTFRLCLARSFPLLVVPGSGTCLSLRDLPHSRRPGHS